MRAYKYNVKAGIPLSSDHSPRPRTVEELWQIADPLRFVEYQRNGGISTDMISHYYDKLLHVARPPVHIVRNSYLEDRLSDSAKEMVELCLRFGKTGVVDEEYIRGLEGF